MDPMEVVGYGIYGLFVLLAVGLACYWCYTRAERRAYREARQLREENLDTVIQWFFTRAVDVSRGVRGGPTRPPVRGNRVTHVRATAPVPVMGRDRDMTSIPMLAWEQA